MIAFPVSAEVRSDFASRFGEEHEGIDIFAKRGAPVLAVADGRVRQAVEKKGGNAVYLTESDGTQYYYAHLDRFEGPKVSRLVKAGDVIGYVGTTGNAKGTQPHIHFEYRPQGGPKVDPFDALRGVVDTGDTPAAKRSTRQATADQKSSAGELLGLAFAIWAITRDS